MRGPATVMFNVSDYLCNSDCNYCSGSPEVVDSEAVALQNGVTAADLEFVKTLLARYDTFFTTVAPSEFQQEMTRAEFGAKLVQKRERRNFPVFICGAPETSKMTIKVTPGCKALIVVERKEGHKTSVIAMKENPKRKTVFNMVVKKIGKTYLAILAQYDDGVYCTYSSYVQGKQEFL